jgi:hypothetical protein
MVNIQGKTVFFTAVTAAWLAAAVIFAGIFVPGGHDRGCTGGECPVCLEMRLIEAFGRLGLCIAGIGFISCTGYLAKPRLFIFRKRPLELKVRCNC